MDTSVDSAKDRATRGNLLLLGLSRTSAELADLGARRVAPKGGEVLHEAGQPIETVIFPVSCVVSVAMVQGADPVDVTTVGREGLIGLPGLLGAAAHDTRAVCRVPGEALHLPLATARQLLAPSNQPSPVLQRYLRTTLTVLMQRVLCNRSHSGAQRCACWLLHTRDRVGADTFALTHATLADMLGVRRATVSDSLTDLQRRGVIRSRRGTVTVLDRRALEAASCACYAVLHQASIPSTG